MAAGLATYQWNNQLKSILLLAGFPLLLVLMIFAFFFLSDLFVEAHMEPEHLRNAYYAATGDGDAVESENFAPGFDHALKAGLWSVGHFGPGAVVLALVWFGFAFFFHNNLMRLATHSQPITRQQMPRIYNMLENLCISRGLTMPQFEVIDSPALNAFASGINDSTYRIVLTRGIIEKLHDDELEAVIGHELTHIINRDARLLIVAVIFTGMISFFAQLGYRRLIYGGRPNFYPQRGGKDQMEGLLIITLLAIMILWIGYFFSVAIRFSLSRKREFLADAGSVELTKNPEAMMRALQRISGNDVITGMPNEVEQMCIENSHAFWGVFATHPPLQARLKAISETTRTPIPELPVSLRRLPDGPWNGGAPPLQPVPPNVPPDGPWGAAKS